VKNAIGHLLGFVEDKQILSLDGMPSVEQVRPRPARACLSCRRGCMACLIHSCPYRLVHSLRSQLFRRVPFHLAPGVSLPVPTYARDCLAGAQIVTNDRSAPGAGRYFGAGEHLFHEPWPPAIGEKHDYFFNFRQADSCRVQQRTLHHFESTAEH
jgi:hypothetical protein